MADEVVATQMVAYFANGTAQLRGRSVYVQFSNHKELKTDQTHSNAVSGLLSLCCVALLRRFRRAVLVVGGRRWL